MKDLGNDSLSRWLAGLAGRKVEETSVPEEVCSRVRLWAQLSPHLPPDAAGGWLVFRDGGRVRSVPLEDGRVVGRGPDVDTAVACPWLSQRHFVIRRVSDGFEVEDLRGKNGTTLNGRPIRSAPLASGDVIAVGDQVFLFVVVADPAPRPDPRRGGML